MSGLEGVLRFKTGVVDWDGGKFGSTRILSQNWKLPGFDANWNDMTTHASDVSFALPFEIADLHNLCLQSDCSHPMKSWW